MSYKSNPRNFFNLTQFIERFERRQRIDIQPPDLVPDLLEHRIVQLEHTELYAVASILGDRGSFLP